MLLLICNFLWSLTTTQRDLGNMNCSSHFIDRKAENKDFPVIVNDQSWEFPAIVYFCTRQSSLTFCTSP